MRWSIVWVTGWIGGLWLGSKGWVPFPVACALAVGVVGGGGWWVYRRWSGQSLILLVAACLLATAYMTWVDDHNQSVWSAEGGADWTGQLSGRLTSPVDVDGNRVQFTVKSEAWQGHNGGARLATGGEKVLVRLFLEKEEALSHVRTLARGDRITAQLTLERPQPARNPGGFNYRRYLYERHIHWLGRVQSLDDLHVIAPSRHPLKPLDRLRDYLGQRIEGVYSEPQAGLIRGMILGERQAVDLQIEKRFATLGLLHLLAISGLHVGVVLALCYGGLKGIGLTRERAALVSLVCLPVYALLTGAAPPVIRATVVSGLALLAIVLRQWKNSFHFLALAATGMLVVNPYWLFAAGFQLSFIISAGIIVGVPVLSDRLRVGPLFLRQTLAVTLVAQVCSFPLLIYYFNEFSLLSSVANLIVVPLVSVVVIPLSFVTVLLAAIALPLAFLLAQINAFIIDQVVFLSHLWSEWEPFHLIWATPSVPWIIGYYAVLSLLTLFWVRRPVGAPLGPRLALLFTFIGLVLVAYYPYPWWHRPLTVTFLDVGQGDAIVIETPQRQTMLLDAGGVVFFAEEPWQKRRDPFDTGEDIVLPFLRHKGIRALDFLVMSHGDADHIGGMRAVVEQLPVRAFIRGPETQAPSKVEQDVLTTLHARSIPVYQGASGAGWEWEDGLSIQWVQPPADQVAASDRNAQSLVLWLSYKGRSLVFTGDADQAVEQQMVDRWDFPPVDVLKAGHHGSGTSTGNAWLAALQPQATVLSLGENNRYHHPHPEVVERLQAAGSAIYRTDRQGGIVVRINHHGQMHIEPTIAKDTQ